MTPSSRDALVHCKRGVVFRIDSRTEFRSLCALVVLARIAILAVLLIVGKFVFQSNTWMQSVAPNSYLCLFGDTISCHL